MQFILSIDKLLNCHKHIYIIVFITIIIIMCPLFNRKYKRKTIDLAEKSGIRSRGRGAGGGVKCKTRHQVIRSDLLLVDI